jgi:MFS family permease
VLAGRAGLHYGWVVVAAAFLVLFLTYGVQYSFGLFFGALAAEFGWSRASLAGVFSLYAGAYSALGLPAGRLTDRWGPRRVVALGGALLGAGLALSGAVHRLGPLYLTYLVAALGMSTAYVPCASTVARWFAARRGAAVGLAMAGAGVGIFACPPLVARLIERAGWRVAYVTLGLALAVGLGALALLLARDPASRGLAPYGGWPAGGAPAGGPPGPGTPRPGGWTVAAAVRHPSFLALVGVFACTWSPVFMPLVHLVPLAGDLGLPAAAGATALSGLGAGSLAGRLGLGALSDVLGRRPTLAAALLLEALGFAGLAAAGGIASLVAAATLFGFAYGAITALMPAIVTDYFGPARAASLVGVVFGAAGTPAAVGPLLGGLVFDATGRYGPAFAAGAALNLLALALLATLARPPGAAPGVAGAPTLPRPA